LYQADVYQSGLYRQAIMPPAMQNITVYMPAHIIRCGGKEMVDTLVETGAGAEAMTNFS
jgi:hypothetical protein